MSLSIRCPCPIVIVAEKSAAGCFIFDISKMNLTMVFTAQEYGLSEIVGKVSNFD